MERDKGWRERWCRGGERETGGGEEKRGGKGERNGRRREITALISVFTFSFLTLHNIIGKTLSICQFFILSNIHIIIGARVVLYMHSINYQ